MIAAALASVRRRSEPEEAACWQFNIAAARPILVAGVAGRDPEWDRDGLERFLAEVRIMEVSDAALRLFDLPTDRSQVCPRPVGALWPEGSHAALSDLLAGLAATDGRPVMAREISRMDRWTDV